MRVLEKLSPKRVFDFFEDICSIPHGSGNTKEISDYCVDFAKKNNLDYTRDSLNNIVINKPATSGYEAHATVVLQGHLDMVCEKEAGVDKDFLTEGLDLFTDGDKIGAKGTTLGADDGIAVAMILAVLESDNLAHPPLQAVFTVDEETGMYGAAGLDATLINGKRLINIDSSNEGVLTVGCAGGAKIKAEMKLKRTVSKGNAYKISVSGLIGGHSGEEIDKGRVNADKFIVKYLKSLDFKYNIADISGGFKDNVIPAASECIIVTEDIPNFDLDKFLSENRTENDPDIKIAVAECESPETVFDCESTDTVLSLIDLIPYGPLCFSKEIEGLVETSANLGVVKTDNDKVLITVSVRSSIASEKEKLIEKIKAICEKHNAVFNCGGDYPAWEYNRNSDLQKIMKKVYKDTYNSELETSIIHAGLECGLLSEKIKGFDAVSIGPDMWDIHTPKERLSISSTERVYNFVCETLKAL